MRNRFAPHIDFSELQGLLGSCMPSNVDMMMERKGHFLVGEWKKPNERISKGQEILLKALAKRPKFTVLIVSGDTATDMIVHRFWRINPDGTFVEKGDSTQDFKDYLQEWFLMADFD